MDQNEKDLLTYYSALPDWAKQEMVALVQSAALGDVSPDYYAVAFEDLMARVDRERDGRPTYLH